MERLFVPYVFTLAPTSMFYLNLIKERRLWERAWFVPILYATLASKPSLSYFYSGDADQGHGFSTMDVVTAVVPSILVLLHLIAERTLAPTSALFARWETFFLMYSHYALAYVTLDATLPTFYSGSLSNRRLPEEYFLKTTPDGALLTVYAASHIVCALLQSFEPKLFGAGLLRPKRTRRDA